jgi:predicted acyltransferase
MRGRGGGCWGSANCPSFDLRSPPMTAESAAFYSTAAQVLPVLFLAIVFEQRVWSSDAATRVFGIQTGKVPNRPFTTAVAVLTVTAFAALFVGEWLAIAAVGGSEADVARYFVTGALVIAGVLVVLPPVLVVLPGLLPTRWAFAKPAPDRLDLTLARAAIVALAIGSAAFTAVGVVLAIV